MVLAWKDLGARVAGEIAAPRRIVGSRAPQWSEDGGTIFIGDLSGSPNSSADEQAKEPFDNLSDLLAKTGSDLKHLVKATYYVTDDEVSKAHNAIRPTYYDPQRPPAASKALVTGTGRPGSRSRRRSGSPG